MNNTFYKSHTHGQIPLSSKGKALMHTLRLAIQEAIQKGDYNQMNAVAHARGELAKYMSALETRPDLSELKPGPMTPVPMSATEVNIRQEAARLRIKPFKSYFDWPWSGYEKLMADMRKDIDREANAAMYNAMLYGTSKPWIGADRYAKITGNSATMTVIDDPINEQELDMSKKAVATRKALEKVRAAKAAKFQPVGIRFLHGPRLEQIYTYKAKRAAKLFLGQEVVVRNERGTNVGVVVTLDEAIPNGWVLDTLTELTHKVAAI